jgi:hypothetical protein
MRKIQITMIAGILLILCISFVSGVVPYGNISNTSGVVVNTNIPLTMEDVAFPPLLFYLFVAIGMLSVFAGIWFIARPDQIPSYAIMACGLFAFGAFLIAAFMAPLVAASGSTVHIVPNGTTNTVYVTEVNTYLFSAWVGYAMWGGSIAGLIILVLGTLSMFRTNKEKSIEQSVNQDGEQKYKGFGKKYSEE